MKTAKLITPRLKGFAGNAAHYKVEPPIDGHSNIVLSSTRAYGLNETYAFPADKEGNITSWSELAISQKDTQSHGDVLADAGYKMV